LVVTAVLDIGCDSHGTGRAALFGVRGYAAYG